MNIIPVFSYVLIILRDISGSLSAESSNRSTSQALTLTVCCWEVGKLLYLSMFSKIQLEKGLIMTLVCRKPKEQLGALLLITLSGFVLIQDKIQMKPALNPLNYLVYSFHHLRFPASRSCSRSLFFWRNAIKESTGTSLHFPKSKQTIALVI